MTVILLWLPWERAIMWFVLLVLDSASRFFATLLHGQQSTGRGWEIGLLSHVLHLPRSSDVRTPKMINPESKQFLFGSNQVVWFTGFLWFPSDLDPAKWIKALLPSHGHLPGAAWRTRAPLLEKNRHSKWILKQIELRGKLGISWAFLSPKFCSKNLQRLGAADAIYQTYAYWLMSMAAGSDVRKTAMYSAVYKGVQSLGAGLAWIIDLSEASYFLQGGLCLTLTLGALKKQRVMRSGVLLFVFAISED